MSHEQKITFNDVLAAYIEDIRRSDPSLKSFSDAARYLIVVGLGAEMQRRSAMGIPVHNPFLVPSKELMKP